MKAKLCFLISYFLSFKALANPVTEQSVASTFIILLAIIALILGIAKIIKHIQLPAKGTKGEIKLLAQMPLGQKERILLLEVNNEQLLVGVTQHQIQLIKKLNQVSSIASSAKALLSESKNDVENTQT